MKAVVQWLNSRQRERPKEAKDSINLVIVGHVDAGKSTLVGHLLYQVSLWPNVQGYELKLM